MVSQWTRYPVHVTIDDADCRSMMPDAVGQDPRFDLVASYTDQHPHSIFIADHAHHDLSFDLALILMVLATIHCSRVTIH